MNEAPKVAAAGEMEIERYTRQQLISAVLEMRRAIGEFESRVGTVRKESEKLKHDSSVLCAYVTELQHKIKGIHQSKQAIPPTSPSSSSTIAK